MIPLDNMLVRITQQDVVYRYYLMPEHRSFIPDFGVYITFEQDGKTEYYALSPPTGHVLRGAAQGVAHAAVEGRHREQASTRRRRRSLPISMRAKSRRMNSSRTRTKSWPSGWANRCWRRRKPASGKPKCSKRKEGEPKGSPYLRFSTHPAQANLDVCLRVTLHFKLPRRSSRRPLNSIS